MNRNDAGGSPILLVGRGVPTAPSSFADRNGGLGTARPTGTVRSWVGRGVTTAPSVVSASFWLQSTLLIGMLLSPLLAYGQLVLVSDESPATVFAGQPSAIRVVFRNTGDAAVETELSTRLYQVAVGVRMPVGDAQLWKKLTVLPQQTVIESFPITVPEVKTPSRFQIEWAGLGRTEIAAYPGELLKQFRALAVDQPLAVFDPEAKLRPLLKKAGVEFTDFEIETVDARLALVWSEKRLPESITARAKKGMAVVWVRPQKLPAFGVRLEAGTILLVPATQLAGIADSPLAQIQLLRYAELALQPECWENLLTERN